ncbi:NEAT domain-containing protein [Weissella confusa]|uniref:NEAT domain-containing protein n=1 Tax=Weissella confusa TaxID=1583 RepID=UPI0035A3CCE9
MSNLSRTASLFSTAVLGGMLLTTSINSVATIAYAAETTAVTSTSNETTTDAIITAEVPMEASDNMDKFFNATAKLAVKGSTTDVTISFKDSVTSMLAMIPELTFDGITLPVNGQQAITFTIPTDDLKPTSGSSVTLASFTSVPMSPHKGYKSNLTFDLSSLLPSSSLKTGSYDLPISADNKMDTWFDKSFSTKIGWLTSQVTVSYQESKQAMLGMIPSLTFDNITKSVNGQRMITFDIPTKDLNPDANGIAKIASFTSVPMSPSRGYASTLSFNMTSAMGESGATDPVAPEVPTTPEQPDNPSESNPEKPSQTALKNGVYSVPLTNYKTGTTTASSMNNYLKTPATVTVKNGQATIDIETSNASIMGMMSNYRFNGIKATASGNHWLVTLPVTDLNKTVATSMTISMNGTVIEQPQADMVFDVEKAVRLGDVPTDTKPVTPSTPEKPAGDTPVATPDTSNDVAQDATHALSILQGDKNESSMAATYILPTIKLSKNADGTYYAYLTTHTPAMMGQNPIRFNDSKHAAKLMCTNLVNGYYQSVFRLTLSASEIGSPILTNIHVQFTSPIVYNENYEIRLVIGDQLSGDTSVNNQNNDQTQNEITDTVIVPRETEATTTTFDPAPAAFTAVASSVPMAATPLATTRLVASPQTVVTPQTATSDKKIKLAPAQTKQVANNKDEKTATKVTEPKAPKQSKIARAAMIGAGVAITAAVGFVGASLALNIFKRQ